VKLTCEENLAKYKKKGSCQKQGSRPRQGKKSKLSSKYQNTLVLAKLKEILLLHLTHMLDQPHHGPGHTIIIIHLWIMIIYICVHI
jgi:hypothetical protein